MVLDFEQKRKFRQFIYSKITLVVLFLISSYAVYSTYNVYLKKTKSQKDLELIEKKLSDLEQKNRELDGQIELLSTSYGVEREIRSKFFVTKSDENMVVVVDEPETKKTEIVKKNTWQKILDFFGI